MDKIIEFWKESYYSDKIAFVYELISFVFTVFASLNLALTADDPNMLIVYPGFLVGSIRKTLGLTAPISGLPIS